MKKINKPLEEVRLLSLYTDLGVFPHGEQEERGNKAVKAEDTRWFMRMI